MRGGDLHSRTRLPAAERRLQIMRGAERLLLEQGYLPLPPEQLGRSIGVSKALIYTYFTDQELLFNAILTHRLQELAQRLPAGKGRKAMLDEAMDYAEPYFEQVVEIGPVVNFVLRDPFMRRKVDAESRLQRERLVRPLLRKLRKSLKLTANEAVAALAMLATVPEEAGVLVRRGELTISQGREYCRDILSACLAGLRGDRRGGS